MWGLLKKADIEQAKQALKLRHAETLRRHAEESQHLDVNRLELETLHCLVDIFVQKYAKPTAKPTIVSPAPVAAAVSPAPVAVTVSHAPVAASASHQNVGAKTSHEARHQSHRRDQHNKDQHQTVFATFVRAASRH